MKLTLDQLPGFVEATITAINTGAWNARENDGVLVEYGMDATGAKGAKVDFQVELVTTGGLNSILRSTTNSPNAPKVTTTLVGVSGETQVTTPSAPRTTTENMSATSGSDSTNTNQTTTGTDGTNTSTTTTPAGRQTITAGEATIATDITSYTGNRTITVTEGAQVSTDTTTPNSTQQTQQANGGNDNSSQTTTYTAYPV
jgi:hypothetical protein